jgi:hypothetical protein
MIVQNDIGGVEQTELHNITPRIGFFDGSSGKSEAVCMRMQIRKRSVCVTGNTGRGDNGIQCDDKSVTKRIVGKRSGTVGESRSAEMSRSVGEFTNHHRAVDVQAPRR